jgi:Flp pilus assembly protein TadG
MRTNRKSQRGVAMMELALTLPLLLAVCFAVTEFGRAIYTYNTLAKSARDAARYLTTQTNGNAAAWTIARNLVAYGNPAGSGAALVPGLTSSNMASLVNICDPSDQPRCVANINQGVDPTINTVTVRITGFQFSPVIDLLAFTRFYSGGSAAITAIPFGDISVTMRKL